MNSPTERIRKRNLLAMTLASATVEALGTIYARSEKGVPNGEQIA